MSSNLVTSLIVLAFWAMQVIANLIFKWGTMGEAGTSRGTWGFILGNIVGASSIVFMMQLYKRWNPNLVVAIGSGGTFLCVQIGLSAVFHTRPLPIHWFGYFIVALGMILASIKPTP